MTSQSLEFWCQNSNRLSRCMQTFGNLPSYLSSKLVACKKFQTLSRSVLWKTIEMIFYHFSRLKLPDSVCMNFKAFQGLNVCTFKNLNFDFTIQGLSKCRQTLTNLPSSSNSKFVAWARFQSFSRFELHFRLQLGLQTIQMILIIFPDFKIQFVEICVSMHDSVFEIKSSKPTPEFVSL